MFLGDLGVEGGIQLIETVPSEELKCEFVQMAHHGQNGVSQEFYRMIRPKICLFDAPLWLWENYLPEAEPVKGSGPFKTLLTRAWMEELGVETYCVHAFGDHLLY